VEWKVPGRAAESAELELYDYHDDPLETKNLAREHPEVVARMRLLLGKQPEALPQISAVKSLSARQIKDRTALFERKDASGDNELSRVEFMAGQPDPADAPRRFDRFDVNQDGKLSRTEFIHMGAAK
jgi:iduronate 2-sulfatase